MFTTTAKHKHIVKNRGLLVSAKILWHFANNTSYYLCRASNLYHNL